MSVMIEKNRKKADFCFCTLALGQKYRNLARKLAQDLSEYAPGVSFVIGTDKVADFIHLANTQAFYLQQEGILHCYNDKRTILKYGLTQFDKAIYIDADTTIATPIPLDIQSSTPIVGCHKPLLKHIQQYRPQDVALLKQVATKMAININQVKWVGEALFIVSRDGGKEKEFFAVWEKIARYLELRGYYSGEGNIMGLAAAKIGWEIDRNQDWKTLKQLVQHLDASTQSSPNQSGWTKLNKKIGFYTRLNKQRLIALKDYEFYYG